MISDKELAVIKNYFLDAENLEKFNTNYKKSLNVNKEQMNDEIAYLKSFMGLISEKIKDLEGVQNVSNTKLDVKGLFWEKNNVVDIWVPMYYRENNKYDGLLEKLYNHIISKLPKWHKQINKKGYLEFVIENADESMKKTMVDDINNLPKDLEDAGLLFTLNSYSPGNGRTTSSRRGRKGGNGYKEKILGYLDENVSITVEAAAGILETTEGSAYQVLHLLKKEDKVKKVGKEYKKITSSKPETIKIQEEKFETVKIPVISDDEKKCETEDEQKNESDSYTKYTKLTKHLKENGVLKLGEAIEIIGCQHNPSVADKYFNMLLDDRKAFRDNNTYRYTDAEDEDKILKDLHGKKEISVENVHKLTGLSYPTCASLLIVLKRKNEIEQNGKVYVSKKRS